MWRLILLLLIACSGFWFGKKALHNTSLHIVEDHPLVDFKPFVVVVYAHNQNLWCERALTSIFEQEYEHYRVIFIDDGSIDQTLTIARRYVLENQQQSKTIVMQNDTRLGIQASVQRALGQCLDKEVVIILDAKDWLTHPHVLHRLNRTFQNTDIALVNGQTITYPSYDIEEELHQLAFYAGALKQVFREAPKGEDWKEQLLLITKNRSADVLEPLLFCNYLGM